MKKEAKEQALKEAGGGGFGGGGFGGEDDAPPKDFDVPQKKPEVDLGSEDEDGQ